MLKSKLQTEPSASKRFHKQTDMLLIITIIHLEMVVTHVLLGVYNYFKIYLIIIAIIKRYTSLGVFSESVWLSIAVHLDFRSRAKAWLSLIDVSAVIRFYIFMQYLLFYGV